MIDIKELQRRLKEDFTPERIVSLAKKGNSRLSEIRRVETFTADRMVIGPVTISRSVDYEFAYIEPCDSVERAHSKCEWAVAQLGLRLENCLLGMRMAKSFSRAMAGMDAVLAGSHDGIGVDAAKEPSSVLYSCGPCPLMLDYDGILFLHPQEDLLQVRFAYYAQVGPAVAVTP